MRPYPICAILALMSVAVLAQTPASVSSHQETNPALIELARLQPLFEIKVKGDLALQLEVLKQKIPSYRNRFTKTFTAANMKGLKVGFIADFHLVDSLDDDSDKALAAQCEQKERELLAPKPFEIVALEGAYGNIVDDVLSHYVYMSQPINRSHASTVGADLSSLDAFTTCLNKVPDYKMWAWLPHYETERSMYIGCEDPCLSALSIHIAKGVFRNRADLEVLGVYEKMRDAEEIILRLRSYFALSVLIQRLAMDGKTKGAIIMGARHCPNLVRAAKYYGLSYEVHDMAGAYALYAAKITGQQ